MKGRRDGRKEVGWKKGKRYKEGEKRKKSELATKGTNEGTNEREGTNKCMWVRENAKECLIIHKVIYSFIH